tara:strand:+ start:2284 stop:2580 length:297 start_codon:yes stop_codon:yes gene_type:complete
MIFNKDGEQLSRSEKREYSTQYSNYLDVGYSTQTLQEFAKAVSDLRYNLDNRIDRKDYAAAMRFIVEEQINHVESRVTRKILEAIDDAISYRMEDLAK